MQGTTNNLKKAKTKKGITNQTERPPQNKTKRQPKRKKEK